MKKDKHQILESIYVILCFIVSTVILIFYNNLTVLYEPISPESGFSQEQMNLYIEDFLDFKVSLIVLQVVLILSIVSPFFIAIFSWSEDRKIRSIVISVISIILFLFWISGESNHDSQMKYQESKVVNAWSMERYGIPLDDSSKRKIADFSKSTYSKGDTIFEVKSITNESYIAVLKDDEIKIMKGEGLEDELSLIENNFGKD